ncbi:MAG: hypothetical protein IPL39_20015 [Opitutaceae bacterium]|nr:hypothetical protein [Opitutaceae bacterium]
MHPALERLCAYDHCRVSLPWFVWARRRDAASLLHRRILALDPVGPGAAVGAARTVLAAGLFMARGSREVVRTWRRLGGAATQGYGVPRTRQLAQLFIALFRYNIPPKVYYRSCLFRLARERWNAIFSHEETTFVLGQFERATMHLDLWSKSGWAAFCAAYGIDTPPLCARAIDGTVTMIESDGLPAGADYFVKPDRDYSGRGGIMLEWQAVRAGWQAHGAITAFVSRDGLVEFLRAHSRTGALVVQERLRNAPDLADLTSRALINFRIVTLRMPDGTISVLMAALRLPPGDQPTSDVVGSTLCVPVDTETGRLGCAESAELVLGARERHPVSGATIEGRAIAQWPEMRARAIAAHGHLPSLTTVGWDLIATDRGVFILEANAVWNGNLAQHWGRAPLGETAWPALMLAHLDAPVMV